MCGVANLVACRLVGVEGPYNPSLLKRVRSTPSEIGNRSSLSQNRTLRSSVYIHAQRRVQEKHCAGL